MQFSLIPRQGALADAGLGCRLVEIGDPLLEAGIRAGRSGMGEKPGREEQGERRSAQNGLQILCHRLSCPFLKVRYDGAGPPAERKTYKNEVNKFFTIKFLARLPSLKNVFPRKKVALCKKIAIRLYSRTDMSRP